MPDEATAASAIDAVTAVEEPNTPETTAPDAIGQGDTQTPEDAEQGYLRHADYTRKTQELAQQRQEFEAQQEQANSFRELVENAFLNQDEDAAQQILEELGYDFDEATGDQPVDPAVAAMQKQIDDLTQFKNEQLAQREQLETAGHIESEFHRLTGEGWDAENPDHDAIIALAIASSEEDGPINVEAGHQAFKALEDRIIENYRAGKYNPAANNANLTGTPASAAIPENASPEARANSILEAHGY